jgi:hypothetical protein
MLSGGLPRDLIRSARFVIELAERYGDNQLTLVGALDDIVQREAGAKAKATSLAIRAASASREAAEILPAIEKLGTIDRVTRIEEAAQEFRDGVAALSTPLQIEDGREILALCDELAIYLEMLAVMRLVGAILSTRRGWKIANEMNLAAKVADLRRSIEVSVPLARARLDDLGKAVEEAGRRAQRAIEENRRAHC